MTPGTRSNWWAGYRNKSSNDPMATGGELSASEGAPSERSVGEPKQCPTCLARYPASFKVCPHDASELEDAPDDEDELLGQRLGNVYEIVRLIGVGGMGRVYEARHTRLRTKRFAVKVLHPEMSRQPEVMARFQREAEAASVLAHENVVSVVDVDRAEDGSPYIVSELLEGEPLGDYFDRVGRVPTAEAVSIVRRICSALEAAHERGVVHRDMKPDNVFLAGESRQVKVLDFGISKLGEGNSSLTKTGMVMGTPDYMPPEQAKGLHVDQRADIYAVGAILYRALTGRKPFQEEDQMATLTAVLVQEPPRPRTINEAIPDGLEVVVQRAMAKEPEERYQTMREFSDDLAPFDERGTTLVNTPALIPAGAEASERVSWLAGVVKMAQTTTLARGARFARPMIVVASAMGILWVVGGVITIAQSGIVWASEGKPLSRIEVWTTVFGAVGALVTPIVLYIRYIKRRVWASTPRAMAFATRLWQTVVASTATFGLTILGIQLYEGVVSGRPDGAGWPGYPIFAFLTALVAGALLWLFSSGSALRGKR